MTTPTMRQFKFSARSLNNLVGVHPDLVKIAHYALLTSPVDFSITEGLRTTARQLELFEQNKSKTLASRHITGHAIDVAAFTNGKLTWNWAEYEVIAAAFKHAANELGVKIDWGGDWKSFRDGPHFQLSYSTYPAPKTATAGEQA